MYLKSVLTDSHLPNYCSELMIIPIVKIQKKSKLSFTHLTFLNFKTKECKFLSWIKE